MQTAQPPIPRHATIQEVMQALRISRATLWRLVRAGAIPPPISVSPGRKVFSAEAVTHYVRELERTAKAAGRYRERR